MVLDGARNPQVVAAVGHLRQLAGDNAGLGEGLVDIPQRAGAAVIGKVHAGGGLALGHIACAVDADKSKRNAAEVIALQGGQAGGHGFIAHAEDLAEVFHVVAGALGFGMHQCIGHHGGGGEVAGQAALCEVARSIRGKRLLLH